MEWLILLIAVATVAYWLVARPNRSGPRPAYTDLSHLPPQFVVFDLETTGLDATRDEIIEFGAIRVNRDSDEHQTYQMLVKPSEKLSAKIVQLTGITQEMLNTDGQLIGEALEGFLDFAGTLPLVSFNAEFDMAFLHAAASRHGRTVANQCHARWRWLAVRGHGERAIGSWIWPRTGVSMPPTHTAHLRTHTTQ